VRVNDNKMRKISFTRDGQKYRVNDENVEKIITHYNLDGPLEDNNQRLATLGLMFLIELSNQGGGVGDIPLEELFAPKIDHMYTASQMQLLEPALETIERYHKEQK